MEKLESTDSREQLFQNAVRALGELAAAAITEMSFEKRALIARATAHGAELVIMCGLNPTPQFVGTVMLTPDAEPIELFRIVPSVDPLRLSDEIAH